jgi:hypothetical protein
MDRGIILALGLARTFNLYCALGLALCSFFVFLPLLFLAPRPRGTVAVRALQIVIRLEGHGISLPVILYFDYSGSHDVPTIAYCNKALLANTLSKMAIQQIELDEILPPRFAAAVGARHCGEGRDAFQTTAI